jgi:hypothetical protein
LIPDGVMPIFTMTGFIPAILKYSRLYQMNLAAIESPNGYSMVFVVSSNFRTDTLGTPSPYSLGKMSFDCVICI